MKGVADRQGGAALDGKPASDLARGASSSWLARVWLGIERWKVPLSIAGAVFLAVSPFMWAFGYDLWSYWTVDLEHPYATINDSLQGQAAYRYAPSVVMLMAPLRLLPLEVAHVIWLGLQLAALWYIGRSWMLVLILFPPVWLDIVYGNINVFLAAVVVAGARYPAVWAFALLSKVTPGVGVLQYVFRREWRHLGLVVVATGGVALASVAIQGPQIWREWIESLILSNGLSATDPSLWIPIPIIPRVVAAGLLIGWGAMTRRAWSLPVAVTIAMPTIWPIAMTPLIALFPALRHR